MARMLELMDMAHRRPKDQWWLDLRPVVRAVSEPPPPVLAAPRAPSAGQ